MTKSPKGPKGFIVVLPGEIIEIAQDDDISWLTLFYALPKELAEKYPDALKIPRSPYEVLYEGSYGAVVKSDMLKMLVWDCYSWAAWQFFKVKDRHGNYREIPGSRSHYAGMFSLWRLSYAIVPYIRMKFEKIGMGFQNLYNMPKGAEIPWLTYQQFGNLVGNLTDIIIEEENWQPVIDAAWEMRSPEDYDDKSSTVKNDFLRTWHHSRSAKPISLEEMMEDEDGDIFGVADPAGDFEQTILSEMQIASFAADNLTDKDREILQFRRQGHTEKEIADKVGYKTASAVHKRIAFIANAYEDFVMSEYQQYLEKDKK